MIHHALKVKLGLYNKGILSDLFAKLLFSPRSAAKKIQIILSQMFHRKSFVLDCVAKSVHWQDRRVLGKLVFF